MTEIFKPFDWIEAGFGTRLQSPDQAEMASLKQIHSAVALVADHAGVIGESDALITDRPGLAISIRTADCYPILLADSRRRVVAAIHAGWRGTAARVVPGTIAEMRSRFGTQPEDIFASIGPGIGACCYVVGEDVARQFGQHAGRLDLAQANVRQLADTGVDESHIEVAGACTFCDAAQFHSYRRDGNRSGRMVSFVKITAPRP